MCQWITDPSERESEEQVTLVLVIRERRHKMTWAMLVPRKGTTFPWIAKKAAKFIDQLGHNRVTLRSAREIAQARLEGSFTVLESCRTWCGTLCRSGQNTESSAGTSKRGRSPARRKDTLLAGGICCVPDEQV